MGITYTAVVAVYEIVPVANIVQGFLLARTGTAEGPLLLYLVRRTGRVDATSAPSYHNTTGLRRRPSKSR